MIKAEIIADSLNPRGKRLTSFILEYPRFIHAEVMTHRVFSKNAASSRAIPIEKMIQQVIDNPAMPVWWGKNQSGMQAKEELDNLLKKPLRIHNSISGEHTLGEFTDMEMAKRVWLQARDNAIGYVKTLHSIGLHKQIANRILEPWFNIRIILTGTDFENFFALRAHKDAQPEFQALAYKMLELYNNSTPKQLKAGEWHIPFGDKFNEEKVKNLIHFNDIKGHVSIRDREFEKAKIKIAIARCARVSYWNFEGKDDYSKDIETCDKLFGAVPRHLSPAEHVAQALDSEEYIGNFCGFKQYRKFYTDENLRDDRVKRN